MAAAMDLIGTIDDDDFVPIEESDESENEEDKQSSKSRRKKKKKSERVPASELMLNESFSFSVGDSSLEMAPLWDLKETIQSQLLAKGSRGSGLELKILKFRENRKRKGMDSTLKHVVKNKKEKTEIVAQDSKEDADSEDNDSNEEFMSAKDIDEGVSDSGEGDSSESGEGDSSDDDVGSDDGDRDNGHESDENSYVQSSDDEEEANEEKKRSFFDHAPEVETDISFTDMNLSRPLLRAVNQIGYVSPTPVQSRTIPIALMGRDICACAATGTGKTAAYMLPVLERLLYRPGGARCTRVMVLVPTRELAIQIHSVAKSLAKFTKVEFCLATGGLDSKSQEAALRNQPDVIIATPGRLVDHLLNAPTFNLQTVEILILDEADRMLDEHFMEQMNEIIKLCPQTRQTMLFSATMTDNVQELVRLSLNKPVKLFVDSNIDVADNLQQEFVRIRQKMEDSRPAVITGEYVTCSVIVRMCLCYI
jgi:ATP-dependent RNA helicase DDX27